ncbi:MULTISPECIES: phage tail sheath subtilisin-like domain-containing protein [Serratia]|uniref:phage tail sheath subtilisin-like domain-containing protein n=1 Tax=Serratia TaxID=613 RepID=UPI00066996AF|nr:phage tail sheath subtilisin-like domain-containing protein [Serratia marcescens]MDP8642914.1 phage tail sheath subtilisin-like domain-containing protein [Serratia marcescens]MDP8730264.1 phage tail sheath subtilisin-like domain-containing protein [Serratia marcescens]MDP8829216.1 phage tail sheath subtilisin-like domain-containing protein [Serratia marcescens]CAB1225642.1 Phage tail sheath protein [Serratia marcescens]CVA66688.1 Mu-like prophage tail sheath protein gpL [Serratia marcescens
MSISFKEIGGDIRVPLTYIEFDNSNAVSGTPAPRQRVLMFGQCAMTGNKPVGTAPLNTPLRVYSASQANDAFGRGSMLALMVAKFIEINRSAELYCIAQGNGTGSAVAATITLSGTASDNGVLALYVAGKRLAVTVYKDDTGAKIAERVTTLINNTSELPVTAETVPDAGGAKADDTHADVKLTAKFIGRSSITDVRFNYYTQEATPPGVIAAVTYPTGNTGNPDIAASIAAMGELQYKYIVMPYLDEPNLNLLRTELRDRWGPVNQADGFAVTSYHGTLGDITAFGISRNDHLISCMGVPPTPEPQYFWAASICAVAAQALTIDPARPLQTLVIPNRMPPPLESRFAWPERNSLLYDGISTFTVNDGEEVQIERLITMYRTNSFGDPDPSYLNVNTIATLSYLRYSTRLRIQQKFPRHKLADDGTQFAPGQPIVTPSIIKTELLALFGEWEEAGLVENFTQFADELIVERNANDRDRIDVLAGPNLINQFRIFAEQIRFIL